MVLIKKEKKQTVGGGYTQRKGKITKPQISNTGSEVFVQQTSY